MQDLCNLMNGHWWMFINLYTISLLFGLQNFCASHTLQWNKIFKQYGGYCHGLSVSICTCIFSARSWFELNLTNIFWDFNACECGDNMSRQKFVECTYYVKLLYCKIVQMKCAFWWNKVESVFEIFVYFNLCKIPICKNN